MVSQLPINQPRLADFCRRHGVRRLALFGSVLRQDFTPTSDVDVLLEFEPETDRQLTYFTLAQLQLELEQLFNRPVDVSLANALDARLRDEILGTAEVQYDTA